MASGLLSIKRRATPGVNKAPRRPARVGTYRYVIRGQSHKPTAVCPEFPLYFSILFRLIIFICFLFAHFSQADVVVQTDKKPKLTPHDRFLREFKYGDALDAAIKVGCLTRH